MMDMEGLEHFVQTSHGRLVADRTLLLTHYQFRSMHWACRIVVCAMNESNATATAEREAGFLKQIKRDWLFVCASPGQSC